MRKTVLFTASVWLAAACVTPMWALAASPFPLQLEMRVPFDPTAFPSTGRTFLMYELYLTNFSASSIDLHRIEVLDADESAGKPITAFDGEQMDSVLRSAGSQSPTNKSDLRQLKAGVTVVAFIQVAFDAGAHLPRRLRHRVLTTEASVEGAVVRTHQTELKVLAPPIRGIGWFAHDGPSNDSDNHHRRGLLIFDGQPSISRRYATDWFLMKDGASFKGDERNRRSYYSYGQPVLAVASGKIVAVRDGIPDNVPGPLADFQPAVPITLETVAGNTITIDLGDGQFASYFHLQPGSLRVKTGDRVRSGEPLALIGCSGDPNVPHLHLEVTTSAKPLVGEGVPYVIDQYRVKTAGGIWQSRTHELPMRNMLVDFGRTASDAE